MKDKNVLCQCEDCVPNPKDKNIILYQAIESILDILKVPDCSEDERECLEERLKKFSEQLKKVE